MNDDYLIRLLEEYRRKEMLFRSFEYPRLSFKEILKRRDDMAIRVGEIVLRSSDVERSNSSLN